jgi:hypothetical protein
MQTTTSSSRLEATRTLPSYVTAFVEPNELNSVVEQLRGEPGIPLVAPTTGRHNLLVQLSPSETAKVYKFVDRLRAMDGVEATRLLSPFEGHLTEKKLLPNEDFALILLGVREEPRKVLEQLKQSPIHSACIILGESGIVVTLSGRNYREVMERVARMARIPGVETTETLFAYKPTWA